MKSFRAKAVGERTFMDRSLLPSLFMALALFMLLPAAATCEANEPCSALFDQGSRAYEKMDYSQAEKLFTEALQHAPGCSDNERVKLHILMAKIHLVNHRQQPAVEQLKDALRVDPYLVVDPFNHSPKIVKCLEQARQELKEESPQVFSDRSNRTAPKAAPSFHATTWTIFGMGAALAAGSGVTLGMAYYEEAEQFDAADRKDESARDRHYQNAKSYALTSGVCGTLSAAMLGTAFYMMWNSSEHTAAKSSRFFNDVTLGPFVGSGRAGVLISVAF